MDGENSLSTAGGPMEGAMQAGAGGGVEQQHMAAQQGGPMVDVDIGPGGGQQMMPHGQMAHDGGGQGSYFAHQQQHAAGGGIDLSQQQQQAQLHGAAAAGQQAMMSPVVQTPMVEIKLFVGRVPRNYDEEALRPIFAEHAGVLEVVIIKDKMSGAHKGSAFVRVRSITEADKAVRALNNTKVLDPSLGALLVRYAEGEAEKLGLPAEAVPGQDQAKLFVGSLPKGVTDDLVHRVFSPYGRIDEIFLLKDPATQLCKGCAFVKFAQKEQALHAIKCLNHSFFFKNAPRPLEVRFAENKKTQQSQRQPGNGGAGRGMAPASNGNPRAAGPWKEYFTQEGRPYYHNEMTHSTQWERPVEFDSAYSGAGVAGRDLTGPPGANIFVFHIPNDWTTADLHTNFGGFGNILSAHIATDRASGRHKGYAFVSFDNINAAVAAVNVMNGFLANGKRLKVSIKQHEDKYVAHLMPGGGPMGQQQGGQQHQQQQMPSMQAQQMVGGMAGMPSQLQQVGVMPGQQAAVPQMQAGGQMSHPGGQMAQMHPAGPQMQQMQQPQYGALAGYGQFGVSPGAAGQPRYY